MISMVLRHWARYSNVNIDFCIRLRGAKGFARSKLLTSVVNRVIFVLVPCFASSGLTFRWFCLPKPCWQKCYVYNNFPSVQRLYIELKMSVCKDRTSFVHLILFFIQQTVRFVWMTILIQPSKRRLEATSQQRRDPRMTPIQRQASPFTWILNSYGTFRFFTLHRNSDQCNLTWPNLT